MPGDPFRGIKIILEKRINEQLTRHFSIDPSADARQVVRRQIEREREQLQRKLRKLQEAEEAHETRELGLQFLIDWLPEFERQLTKR